MSLVVSKELQRLKMSVRRPFMAVVYLQRGAQIAKGGDQQSTPGNTVFASWAKTADV